MIIAPLPNNAPNATATTVAPRERGRATGPFQLAGRVREIDFGGIVMLAEERQAAA